MNVMAIPPVATGFTTGAFLEALGADDGKFLTFIYSGREVQPGYHVTEVKAAELASLDCGANPEAWAETIIQLWDVDGLPDEPTRPMTVRTFLGIMRKFSGDVGLKAESALVFEVSDPQSPLSLYGVEAIERHAGKVVVALAARPASCKPRDRWLEQQASESRRAANSCCGPS